MEKEHTNLKEQLKQLQGAKNKLATHMDHLTVSDKYYDKKYQDMQERMDGLYDEIDAMELSIEEVHLYEKEQEDGRFLKHIKFKLPVFFNRKKTEELDWDNESTVETVVLLKRKNSE